MPKRRLNYESMYKLFVYSITAWLGAMIMAIESWDDKTTLSTLSDKQMLVLIFGPILIAFNTLKSYLSTPELKHEPKDKRNDP